MVYIIIFAIILCGIYRYDFLSRTDAKLGVFSYIFILLTCVSVLKYRVGSDILVYMSEYGDYLPLNKLTVSYVFDNANSCLLYTSPSPRDGLLSRMPSSA